MPATAVAATVSESRHADILERIMGVFAAKGFEGASMQDLARAAGMSAGNFYRYFASKDAIVAAMIDYDMVRIEQEFAWIMQADDTMAALRAVLRRRVETVTPEEGQLWSEIEATSLRRPEIAAMSQRIGLGVGTLLTQVFARVTRLPVEVAEKRFSAHAAFLMMLVKGMAVEGCPVRVAVCGERHLPSLRALVLRHIDAVLAEIVPQSPAAGPSEN
jgi:AcrR family transcriptional regulator